MKPFNRRLVWLTIFLACSAMMLFGYYLQYALDLEPCALCITQRAFIVLCGFLGLAGALHGPARVGAQIYGASIALAAFCGGGFSIRQLWLQNLPADQAPACGPSIAYLLETFPLSEALVLLLRGDGNCAEVVWTFIGLSIPAWTLAGFFVLALLGLVSIPRNGGERQAG